MLEILILISLARKIGATVTKKGHKKGFYQLILVLLWFGGEIAGAIVGYVFGALLTNTGDPSPLLAYVFALAGAIVGAVIAVSIANSLKPVNEYDDLRDPDYPKEIDRHFGDRPRTDDFTRRLDPRDDERYSR